jgi:hypothetical protein
VAPRQIDQFFQCAMAQPRIGRMRDRFRVNRLRNRANLRSSARAASSINRWP